MAFFPSAERQPPRRSKCGILIEEHFTAEHRERPQTYVSGKYQDHVKYEGVSLAGGSGAYKSQKRKKELMRQKKQEQKRQKRFNKDAGADRRDEPEPHEEQPAESSEEPVEAE